MIKSTLAILAISLALTGCTSDPSPSAPAESTPVSTRSGGTDTLRYAIDPSFDGRVLLVRWNHVSFQSPLAVRTMGTRPMAEAFAISGRTGSLALPSKIDSQFEFYASLRQYAADESNGTMKPGFVDSLQIYETQHRWAMAPLVIARTDEFARMTIAQTGEKAKLADTAGLASGYVLLWVRDSIQAEQDGLLTRRKLTGKFKAGWHLLQYKDSGRSLTPCPWSDTVRFRPDAPNPNLV